MRCTGRKGEISSVSSRRHTYVQRTDMISLNAEVSCTLHICGMCSILGTTKRCYSSPATIDVLNFEIDNKNEDYVELEDLQFEMEL